MFIKSKKYVSLGIFLSIVLVVSISVHYKNKPRNMVNKDINVEALYISYNTEDELAKNSDAIIVGEVLKDFKDREHIEKYINVNSVGDKGDKRMTDFYTISDINVISVIKNYDNTIKENSNMKILEPITQYQNNNEQITLRREGYQELKTKTKYIIFLARNTEGVFVVFNPYIGKFSINESVQKNEEYTSITKKIESDVFTKYSQYLK